MRHLLLSKGDGSHRGAASVLHQLLPAAAGALHSSALQRLENSALHLFVGEETSCLPWFAA